MNPRKRRSSRKRMESRHKQRASNPRQFAFQDLNGGIILLKNREARRAQMAYARRLLNEDERNKAKKKRQLRLVKARRALREMRKAIQRAMKRKSA